MAQPAVQVVPVGGNYVQMAQQGQPSQVSRAASVASQSATVRPVQVVQAVPAVPVVAVPVQPVQQQVMIVPIHQHQRTATRVRGKNVKLRPSKSTGCYVWFIILLTCKSLALLFNLLFYDLNNGTGFYSEVRWQLVLLGAYLFNVVLSPVTSFRFKLHLYSYNEIVTAKLEYEREKQSCRFCCNSPVLCCKFLFRNLFNLILLVPVAILVVPIIIDTDNSLWMIPFAVCVLYNIRLSSHLFLNAKRNFTIVFVASWVVLRVIFFILTNNDDEDTQDSSDTNDTSSFGTNDTKGGDYVTSSDSSSSDNNSSGLIIGYFVTMFATLFLVIVATGFVRAKWNHYLQTAYRSAAANTTAALTNQAMMAQGAAFPAPANIPLRIQPAPPAGMRPGSVSSVGAGGAGSVGFQPPPPDAPIPDDVLAKQREGHFKQFQNNIQWAAQGLAGMFDGLEEGFGGGQDDWDMQSEISDFDIEVRGGDFDGQPGAVQLGQLVSRKKTRQVQCCFDKCTCHISMCWKCENLALSIAFWLLWGVFFSVGFSSWLLLPVCFFAVVVTTWNPLYYSGGVRYNYDWMMENDEERMCCGVCGCCQCCKRCCITKCRKIRRCCSCTPIVCVYRIAYGFGITFAIVLLLVATGVNYLDFLLGIAGYDSDITRYQARLGIYLCCFIVIVPLYYVPSVGYLFYQSPIAFGLFNVVNAFVFFVCPVFAWTALHEEDSFMIRTFRCSFFADYVNDDCMDNAILSLNLGSVTTPAPTGMDEPEPTDDADILELLQPEGALIEVIIVCFLLITLYLSLAGFSCAYYRFRRALVHSQRKIYNVIKGKLLYGTDFFMFELTLTKCFTLSFAFFDFVSDFLFVVANNDWANDLIQYSALSLFILQVFVQLFSLWGAVTILQRKFQTEKRLAFVDLVNERYCCKAWCIFSWFDWIVKHIFYLIYGVWIAIISIFLGLTKLLAIKQVQEWWLTWMIVDYKEHLQNAKELEIQNQEQLDRLESVHSPSTTQRRKNTRSRKDTADSQTGGRSRGNSKASSKGRSRGASEVTDTGGDGAKSTENIASPVAPGSPMNYSSPSAAAQSAEPVVSDVEEIEINGASSDDQGPQDVPQVGTMLDEVEMQPAAVVGGIGAVEGPDGGSSAAITTAATMMVHPGAPDTAETNGTTTTGGTGATATVATAATNMYLGDEYYDDEGDEDDFFCLNLKEQVDRLTPKSMLKYKIEANVYNAYFVSELIVETLPQLILNVVNSHFNEEGFGTFGIISAVFSGVVILWSVIKFTFFVGVMDKPMTEFML